MSIIRPPLKLIQIFPNNTLQRVVLNGQNSSWIPVFAGILLAGFSFQTSQGSAGFRPLFFLISINYLAEGISWTIAIRNLLLMIYHCFLLSIYNIKWICNSFFLIGIHSMQGWTATRHGVTRKEAQKRSNMDL